MFKSEEFWTYKISTRTLKLIDYISWNFLDLPWYFKTVFDTGIGINSLGDLQKSKKKQCGGGKCRWIEMPELEPFIVDCLL